MIPKVKLVVLISFLVLLPLCSSGFEEDHGVLHTEQYSLNKVEETFEGIMDYPEPGPNPKHRPKIPGHPPAQKNL
ncbi:hypothetical protein AALP_AA5G115900 [Arabis alpina]|uniref:Transmembrane protein n=1 Tax=Arabis alpina TaxID=50452 RepID=A0A087GWG4_ARAAL|nr:hypothetical protein AALP_AA5G115900 [Arabis alpina]